MKSVEAGELVEGEEAHGVDKVVSKKKFLEADVWLVGRQRLNVIVVQWN